MNSRFMKRRILITPALMLVLVFAALSQGPRVEMVFFGPGLNMLRKTNAAYAGPAETAFRQRCHARRMPECERLMNVKTEDLFPFTAQVDSGVAELARKQEAGWAYIN